MFNLWEAAQGSSRSTHSTAFGPPLPDSMPNKAPGRGGYRTAATASAGSDFMDTSEPAKASMARSRTFLEVESGDSDWSVRPHKRQRMDHPGAASLLDLAETVVPGLIRTHANVGQDSNERPVELVVVYQSESTAAFNREYSHDARTADGKAFSPRVIEDANRVLSTLGFRAAEIFWSCTIENAWNNALAGPPARTSKNSAKLKPSVQHVIEQWSPLKVGDRGKLAISSKLTKLLDILQASKPLGDSFRGIIIVRHGVIARTLTEVLNQESHARCAVLSGDGTVQQEVFRAFATGTYNLLVLTRSYEDLDIPKASVVMCFDIFDSDISYAYASACCSGRDSHLVHMAEKGNAIHQRILSRLMSINVLGRRWVHKIGSDPGSVVPPATLCDSDSARVETDEEDDSVCKIQDPTTNALLTKVDATAAIYRSLALLPENSSRITDEDRPLFQYHATQSGGKNEYTCTVIFLDDCPISNVRGPTCHSREEARRAACFEACRQLFQQGVLDCHLFPKSLRSSKQGIEQSNNPSTASTASGVHRYTRKAADFWQNARSGRGNIWYPTIISPGILDHNVHAPVAMLTRLPLPELAEFSIFSFGYSSNVRLQQGAPFAVDQERLGMLHKYTLRISRAIMNKEFSCPLENLAYLFAPLDHTFIQNDSSATRGWRLPDVNSHVLWDLVHLAAEQFMVPISLQGSKISDDAVEDTIVLDRSVEFTNRLLVIKIRRDLTPLSKTDDSPREAGFASFVEYCKARRKGFEGLKHENQPMLEVAPIPAMMNCLLPMAAPSIPASKQPVKYLIPELCRKFTIPASAFRTALLLPSITRRIDEQLLVKEMNAHFFGGAILECHLLAAITAPSACVQFDYERLELLGDSFLKYVSSIHCFVALPSQASGSLHHTRQGIISNKTLMTGATRVHLQSYIQSKPMVVKLWEPSLPASVDVDAGGNIQNAASVTSKSSKKKKQKEGQNVQWLGDKTVADVVEAIIGAACLSGGEDLALLTTKALNVALPNIEHWSDFIRHSPPSQNRNVLPNNVLSAVEAKIQYRFKRRHLLAQALTHPSIQGPDIVSYDRLEFLGDAVLDYLVVRYIFQEYPHLSPGGLTILKSAMVSNHALAALCVHTELYKHIQHLSPNLSFQMQTYVETMKVQRRQELQSATREQRMPCQYWLDIQPPKVLSDVVESIIGALYISDEFSDVGVQSFFNNILRPFYDQHIRLQTLSLHPNVTLFHWLQAEGCQEHRMLKEVEGRDIQYHMLVHDVILASASDGNAAVALRRASTGALDALEGDPDFLTRTCDCRATHQSKKAKKDPQKEGYEVEE